MNMVLSKLTDKINSANQHLSEINYNLGGGYEIIAQNVTKLDVECVRTAVHNILYTIESSRYPVEIQLENMSIQKDGSITWLVERVPMDVTGSWLALKNAHEILRLMELHCEPTFLNTHSNDFSNKDTFSPDHLDNFLDGCRAAENYTDLHKVVDNIGLVPASTRKPTGTFSKIFAKKY